MAEPKGRTVPMKVLCLGYSRTGTRSLREALITLGYVETYHTVDTAMVHPSDCQTWLKWLRAKHDGVGRVPGRKDFDTLLGGCQAICDMPAAYFAEELLEAYPDAKVILTVRDVDEWHKSVTNTVEVVNTSTLQAAIGVLAIILRMPNRWNWPMFQKLRQALYGHDFAGNGKASFEAHYARVRALVPADRLLEYHVSKGWAPLCEFLGKPAPEGGGETPFINQTREMNEYLRRRRREDIRALGKRLLDIGAYAALTLAVAKPLMSMIGRQL